MVGWDQRRHATTADRAGTRSPRRQDKPRGRRVRYPRTAEPPTRRGDMATTFSGIVYIADLPSAHDSRKRLSLMAASGHLYLRPTRRATALRPMRDSGGRTRLAPVGIPGRVGTTREPWQSGHAQEPAFEGTPTSAEVPSVMERMIGTAGASCIARIVVDLSRCRIPTGGETPTYRSTSQTRENRSRAGHAGPLLFKRDRGRRWGKRLDLRRRGPE